MSKYILGVTSCPVGIAHTYMAASNLEKCAKKRADAVIVASDVRIKNGERFADLPTLTVGVSEAIKDADGIIDELLEALE